MGMGEYMGLSMGSGYVFIMGYSKFEDSMQGYGHGINEG